MAVASAMISRNETRNETTADGRRRDDEIDESKP